MYEHIDYKSERREFHSQPVAEAFEEVDKEEEKLVDKYFKGDIEHERGLQLAKTLKGQLRRIDKELSLLVEIRTNGMPPETD